MPKQTRSDHTQQTPNSKPKPSNKPATRSKIEVLILHLQRPRGVTLAALCKATDWKSHSVRAALSRMPARGHRVIRIQENNRLTRYRIT